LGGAVLLTGVYLFFLLRARHKKEKLQQVYDTETRISKKVHDEVANDLYHVMTQLQHPDIPHEQLLDRLDRVYQKTRDISRESSLLDLEGDYAEVLRDLLLSYQSETVRIVTRNLSAVDWDRLNAMKKAMLYRVLQELMINMKKHSNATAVALICTQTRNNIRIVYSDNGVGVTLQKKSGLANTETRMESIGGSITFETAPQKGFKALLTV
jgi:signal transduction histidine kinase